MASPIASTVVSARPSGTDVRGTDLAGLDVAEPAKPTTRTGGRTVDEGALGTDAAVLTSGATFLLPSPYRSFDTRAARVAVDSVAIGTSTGTRSDTLADTPPGERFGGRSPIRTASVILQRYVALFHDAVALDVALAQLDAAPDNVWHTGLYGFSADLSDAQLARVRAAPGLLSVDADEPVAMSAAQTNSPWSLDRIDQRNLPLDTTYTYAWTGSGVSSSIGTGRCAVTVGWWRVDERSIRFVPVLRRHAVSPGRSGLLGTVSVAAARFVLI